MFYEPAKNDHGLRFAPFKSCVVPRPIAWVSTVNVKGVMNLSPFSQNNILGWDPPYVMFSAFTRFDGRRKDSVANAEETGEFVFNMATYALRDAVVLTSAIEEPGIDEMAQAGLTPAPSRMVKPPRVAECPISLECKHYQTTILPSDTAGLVQLRRGRPCRRHSHRRLRLSPHPANSTCSRYGRSPAWAISTTPRSRTCSRLRPANTSENSVIGMSGGRVVAG